MVSTGLPSGAAVASSKKAAAAKAAAAKKKSRQASAPGSSVKVGELVDSAIIALKESGGSTLPAIKKYIAATYNVDAERLTPAIKAYLKTIAAASRGSFKVSPARKPSTAKRPAKKSPVKKPKAPKKAPKKKSLKTLAAKPPKPKAKKPAKKAATKPRKTATKKTARK